MNKWIESRDSVNIPVANISAWMDEMFISESLRFRWHLNITIFIGTFTFTGEQQHFKDELLQNMSKIFASFWKEENIPKFTYIFVDLI